MEHTNLPTEKSNVYHVNFKARNMKPKKIERPLNQEEIDEKNKEWVDASHQIFLGLLASFYGCEIEPLSELEQKSREKKIEREVKQGLEFFDKVYDKFYERYNDDDIDI